MFSQLFIIPCFYHLGCIFVALCSLMCMIYFAIILYISVTVWLHFLTSFITYQFHYTAKTMQTPKNYTNLGLLNTSFQNHGHWPAVTAFTLLVSAFLPDGWLHLLPFRYKCISEVQQWCWVIRSDWQSHLYSSQSCQMWLRSRLCAGESSSFTSDLENYFAMCLRALLPQSWKHTIVQNIVGICIALPQSWESCKRRIRKEW